MEWTFLIFGTLYSAIILYFFVGLFRLDTKKKRNKFKVSVLVPARNEASGITNCLKSLAAQTYPKNLYEVFIINDNSTDDTGTVSGNFILNLPNFHLLNHYTESTTPTYKKQALQFAFEKTSGEIIMTVDADTMVQPEWIEQMISCYSDDTGLVAGLITFGENSLDTIFKKMQMLEFAGIVFCGVGSVGNANPIICNGSNLSYRRKAFLEVGGYDGHAHLPSGDDDLLIQNIQKRTDWRVKYCVEQQAINFTHPVTTLKGFLNQRSRWASKSIHYPSKILFITLVSIYLFYLMIIAFFPLTILGLFTSKYYFLGILLKIVPEFAVVLKGLSFLKRKRYIKLFFLAQLFQIPYILYVGLMGYLHKFNWKEQ